MKLPNVFTGNFHFTMVMTPTRLIVVPTHIDIVISTPILIDMRRKVFFNYLHIIILSLVIILYTRKKDFEK